MYYYYIDANLIFGYINPVSRLHPVAIPFFKSFSNPRNFILLFSVEKEIQKKIRNLWNSLKRELNPYLRSLNPPNIQHIETLILQGANRDKEFIKLMFKIFRKKGYQTLNYTKMINGLNAFRNMLQSELRSLVRHWVVRPSTSSGYVSIFSDNRFINHYKIFEQFIHSEDAEHLALAVYVTQSRSRTDNYFFYTDDGDFNHPGLRANTPHNFTIKLIKYRCEKWLGWSSTTNSFNKEKEKLKYIPDPDIH